MNPSIEILKSGIHAVQPSLLFPQLFSPPVHPLVQDWLQSSDRYLLCAGKAAVSSAESILQSNSATDFFVLAPAGVEPGTLDPAKVHFGAHPVPDDRSFESTRRLLQWIDTLPAGAPILVVLSGGASALLVAPADGISLEAKYQLNRLLLTCGASIHEMNAVRKHCSAVKGGQLGLRAGRLQCNVLLISDVIGNDPSVIGSGPFYPDPSTFFEAAQVLDKHGIWNEVPVEIRQHVELGMAGKIPETPKPGSLHIPHDVVASNDMACRAAATRATELGYVAQVFPVPVSGPVEDAAKKILAQINNAPPSTALIFGGEVTVRLTGNGTGGRNQHLALMMTPLIAGRSIIFAAAGTDGVDGNSDAAGAWTDGHTAQRAKDLGLNIDSYIARFNSYSFFHHFGQNIFTGPTGTNVMDLYIALT